MNVKFWIVRTALTLSVAFGGIFLGQYLKTKNSRYALVQAAIWGSVATAIYLGVLWRKLRKNKSCPAVIAADKR